MKQTRTDFSIVAVVLATSFLSLVLFSAAWSGLFNGRIFSGTTGHIAILLFPSLPFVWPYVFSAIIFRRRHGFPRGLWWTLGSGVAGGVFHAFLVRGSFHPGE